MKLTTLLSFWLFTFSVSFAQTAHVIIPKSATSRVATSIDQAELNGLYFILGTQKKYLERRIKQNPDAIDSYFPHEESMAKFLHAYTQKELTKQAELEINVGDNSSIISKQLAQSLANFYEGDVLKQNLFETEKQKLSFLAGVYYRFGNKVDDSILKISLPTSSKYSICYALLKELACPQVVHKHKLGAPLAENLYFIPTLALRNQIEKIEQERLKVERALEDQLIKNYIGIEDTKQAKLALLNHKEQERKSIALEFNKLP